MPRTLLALVVDCKDSAAQAEWWATVLSHQVSERNEGEYEVSDPSGSGTPLYFMNVPEPKTVKDRLHLDITTEESLNDEVRILSGLGATLVELRQDSDTLANPDRWAVMRDPEGNEFCVFEVRSVTGMA